MAERRLESLRLKLTEAEEQDRALWEDESSLLKHWFVLGPFQLQDEANDGLDHEYIPAETSLSPSASQRVRVRDLKAAWHPLQMERHQLDFSALFAPGFGDRILYAVCYILSESDHKNLRMRLNGGTRRW